MTGIRVSQTTQRQSQSVTTSTSTSESSQTQSIRQVTACVPLILPIN